MAEPLFITDLLLAAFAAISAIPLGLRAAGGRRLCWPLTVTTLLIAARMAVTALLWADSWYLVSDRVIVALPVAAVPLAVTIVLASRRVRIRATPVRVAAQMAAIGVLISGYLAWVPQDPADRPLIAAVALVILAATGTVAGALLRPRSADSRVCRATVRDRTTSDSGRSRRAVR